MLRIGIKRSKYLLGFLPFNKSADNVAKDSKTTAFYKEAKENETGWERLCEMFTADEFGSLSPELSLANQAAWTGLFIGICYGGFVRSRVAYMDFMERNQATTYTSQFEAKKKLQDTVTVSFGKGAFQWGWRLGLFTGSYVLLTTVISVYRGRSSLLEYAVAGGVTGGMYKVSLGVRGVVVGAALGTVLGCVAGSVSLALMYVTGTTMEEVRFWQHGWKEARKRKVILELKKAAANEADPLTKHHEALISAPKTKVESTEVPHEV